MKRILALLLAVTLIFSQAAYAADEDGDSSDGGSSWFSNVTSGVVGWVTDAAEGVADWASDTAEGIADWASETASSTWGWVSETASAVWSWTADAASGAWGGIEDFFDPPSTKGDPNIVSEPELPAGTKKMYLGYIPVKTGLDNGYSGEKEIGRNDPHFGLSIGKFYVSGFTSAISEDGNTFIFLKTVGDNVELHFELTQDIDMLGGDTLITINPDDGGYDKHFGISPTYFGRGTLIVQHTDFQNDKGVPQIYTDYLTAKQSGTADTVISLNEEGDYEVELLYEIKEDHYILGVKIPRTTYTDYKIIFKFSVRNGNCMVFPFDAVTGEELKNGAVAENGFYLDLAYSRYLDINVKYSVLTEGPNGWVEDVRFNRPAADGDMYTREGLYTITVSNRYTGEQTVKTIYVGTDDRYIAYASQGMSVDQIIQAMN